MAYLPPDLAAEPPGRRRRPGRRAATSTSSTARSSTPDPTSCSATPTRPERPRARPHGRPAAHRRPRPLDRRRAARGHRSALAHRQGPRAPGRPRPRRARPAGRGPRRALRRRRHRGRRSAVAGTDAADAARAGLAAEAARRAGLPTRCVRVLEPRDAGPRRPPPPARPARSTTRGSRRSPAPCPTPTPRRFTGSLRERYAVILGHDAVAPDDTFASLGGDSLSYVEASLHVEERLGYLPRGWHLMTVARLEALARPRTRRTGGCRCASGVTASGGPGPTVARPLAQDPLPRDGRRPARRRDPAHRRHPRPRLQAPGHRARPAPPRRLQPGAVRASAAPTAATRVRRLLTALRRIAAPAVVVAAAAHVAHRAVRPVDGRPAQLGPRRGAARARTGGSGSSSRRSLVLLVVTAVVATPWGDRLERRHPFALPLALAGLGMLWWKEVLFPPVPHMQGSPAVVAWLFFLGWAAARAEGVRERLVVTAVAIPTVGTFSGNPRRDLLTLTAALLVLWVPDAARAPRASCRPCTCWPPAPCSSTSCTGRCSRPCARRRGSSVAAGLAAGIPTGWRGPAARPSSGGSARPGRPSRRSRAPAAADAVPGPVVGMPVAVAAPLLGSLLSGPRLPPADRSDPAAPA